MEQSEDIFGNKLLLSFARNSFAKKPEHVLVICRHHGKWLLTKNKKRGLEFPGGKAEKGETLEQAARREVFEETGATLKSLIYIGEYEVCQENSSFVKAIFYGETETLAEKDDYYETDGPVLVGDDLLASRTGEEYSFIMKDFIIEKSIEYINNLLQRCENGHPV